MQAMREVYNKIPFMSSGCADGRGEEAYSEVVPIPANKYDIDISFVELNSAQ